MASAEVGDDVLDNDPTALALQRRLAQLLGKEAALFVPSGTMANQLALRTQTEPGDEVLCDTHAHLLHYESGAAAALSGLQFRTYESSRGGVDVKTLAALRRPESYVTPRTRLVAVENTHNHRGGEIFDLERLRAVGDWCRRESLRLHLDGARLWNASVASGHPVAAFAAGADTVSVCFSKGLGAPVGSALVGDALGIQRARRFRRMFGGAMRQVGVLAAAALYALDHNMERLAEDHANAQRLGEVVEKSRGLRLQRPVDTNIVMVEVTAPEDSATALVEELARHDIGAVVWDPRTVRLVTHLDVDAGDIERVADVLRQLRG